MNGAPEGSLYPDGFHQGPLQRMSPSGLAGALLSAFAVYSAISMFVPPSVSRVLFDLLLVAIVLLVVGYAGSAVREDEKARATEEAARPEVDALVEDLETSVGPRARALARADALAGHHEGA